jgi:DNA-binding Xre family transcriptional regulator
MDATEKLCKYFGVSVGEMFEYVPETGPSDA